MAITIYHNPRCSKSRQTLALIREQGIQPKVIEYLKEPPDAKELKRILKLLGMTPRQLMRSKEKQYRESGLDDPDLGDDELIDTMVRHPILIERPIVITPKGAVLGRPPERVLQIL